jgi:hypothetical protein
MHTIDGTMTIDQLVATALELIRVNAALVEALREAHNALSRLLMRVEINHPYHDWPEIQAANDLLADRSTLALAGEEGTR